jgi:hypothetical protein
LNSAVGSSEYTKSSSSSIVVLKNSFLRLILFTLFELRFL